MKFHEHNQEQIIPALKVLGEPNRLRILYGLGLECRPVTDIINATGLAQTNVSFHLRVLREAGFVRAERRGAFIYYCLADPELLRILHDLMRWLDARQTPVAGLSDQSSHPADPKSALAETEEV
ncbi:MULTISPECIES: ArsR/SmtB family transcription factor [Gammaproteobacteria]|uniref:Winged helix-turn-helix transcriptional regulator n=1 Tax=Stenotrophomonas lactitubi TaxID=2045214 RepID=A0AAW4GDI0_9GAMM|nr:MULTISPECIES: metalloregulator ArsR/SmtB family transcription factor [Gammaproteobacteria]MBK2957949.1 winged helix-turn-helix transcriptional regulator [Enterobacter hormaechei]MBM9912250.1 winged helix-turn-helix transcriptional regulator [Stenotrophomonas lactitubi]MBM9920712.1 winged helix-turn-helix transcriptional regulator [Stenotrophomonas lactitubi]MBM9937846.1 winged helix-turn-helix transcriptional regulator [Stenotrophomonas lactitubi]GBC57233.1 transcriptional regulator, ArsR f